MILQKKSWRNLLVHPRYTCWWTSKICINSCCFNSWLKDKNQLTVDKTWRTISNGQLKEMENVLEHVAALSCSYICTKTWRACIKPESDAYYEMIVFQKMLYLQCRFNGRRAHHRCQHAALFVSSHYVLHASVHTGILLSLLTTLLQSSILKTNTTYKYLQ